MQTYPTSDEIIRLLIIDSSPVVRAGIGAMLKADSPKASFQITEVDDLSAGLEKIAQSNFQLVLLEEGLLSGDSTVAKTITRMAPGTGLILMGVFTNARFVSSLLEHGTQAFIPKTITVKELKAAIFCVLHNEPYFCSRVASLLYQLNREPLPTLPKISHREAEILLLIVKEKTTPEIARQLVVATSTVETHRRNLMLKLQVKNTAGLVRAAYEYNLLSRQ
jgi:DNA-binding NarL/FixJ family response regulator